ncbi:MAG: response regulator [Candidatus Scalindua rubra]|uniref:Response regulator n=1 Tax=Candidatus Scalindua rubra TaxID=1872076 RepID=A0A1E3X9H3_9BACT|nr:MAG: response regulator [Candidatus Scalindua rubra]
MSKILVVDDEVRAYEFLKSILERHGHDVITSNNGNDALNKARKEDPDVMLLDVRMPGMDGIEVLKQLKKAVPLLPVILVTAVTDIDTAVQAIKLGAYDYVTKPLDSEKINIILKNALTELGLKREVSALRSKINKNTPLFEIMGSGDAMKKIYNEISNVAPTDYTIVLQGETGTGKELVARAIHNQSFRKDGEFFAVDCGAIPETLIESELYGYEKGAFTGADKRKEGYFELASNGTLFLDEIGNLPINMQSKLLRALEERRIRRLGGKRDIPIDVRIIVANNNKLENLMRSGVFREDLFYRLNEFTIELPPLRKRKEDLVFLIMHFLDETKLELKKNITGFSDSALDRLIGHNWPGNVRELRNVIRKAVLICPDNTEIDAQNISISIGQSSRKDDTGNLQTVTNHISKETTQLSKVEIDDYEGLSLKDIAKKSLNRIEKDIIMDVLKRTGGNKSKAARILKINNTTMHYKIKEYGIKPAP